MKGWALIIVAMLICIERPAAGGERWLVERARPAGAPAAGAAGAEAWAPAAAELMLRRDLGRLHGVTAPAKADVKTDIATLELNSLGSAKGETRITLGKFARASGLLVLDASPHADGNLEITLRVIDLGQAAREKTLSETAKGAADVESAVQRLAAGAAGFLGRTPSAEELAGMRRLSGLTKDGLIALAKGSEAKTPPEREALMKQATTLSPKAALAWHLYALELHAKGAMLDAISAYRGAITLEGDAPRTHYDLGNAFFDEKRYGEAASEYERAIALDPGEAASHENLVSALRMQNLGDMVAVLDEYRKATAGYDKSAVVHAETGRMLAGLAKVTEALAELRRAKELDPRDTVARYNLAHALEQAGKDDEAVSEYKELITLAPNYAKALNNLGRLYEKKGKDPLALYHYQKAVEYAPDYALAWNNLGILYGRRGQGRLEMEAFRQEVKLTPKDPFAYYNLGVACHRAGETKNAIEAYKKALELTPDDKPTHWQLAHAYERAGLWNLANAEWNAVLKLTPTPEEKATAEKHLKENEGK